MKINENGISRQSLEAVISKEEKVASFGRRAILSSVFGAVAFTILTGCAGLAEVGRKMEKGLGIRCSSGPWCNVVKSYRASLALMAKQTSTLGYAQADLAEALGLKKQAALLRGQAQSLEKKGDTLGGSDLEEFGKNSLSVQSDINRRIKGATELSVAEKAAIGKGVTKMIPAAVKTGLATTRIILTTVSATKLGKPKPTDLLAIPVALQLPQMAEKAKDVIPKLFEAVGDLQKIAAEKDIAVPDMPDAPSFS